mmetsp:Transcript_145534/g.362879  ORF Transcript_145534/g.362879 Transcript_145534/m.362879 type:complete len:330 (+) Transcript_145534:92-1081(+)
MEMGGPPSTASDLSDDLHPRRSQNLRTRPLALGDCRSAPPLGHDALEEDGDVAPQPMRPNTHAGTGSRRPMALNLSSSLSSFKASLTDPSLLRPDTPLPERNDFRNVTGKVEVIMFDFDGTLTATPGDRQVRAKKRAEICERAPLLQPRLQALREAGCLLGIISKSTEVTIRDALLAGGLLAYFNAPIIAKAVGFEGKIGFINDLARRGSLRHPGDRRPGPAPHRILLVDDDVLELERANAGGLQTYAAPSEGGLREEDFDAIQDSLHKPPGRPKTRQSLSRCSSAPSMTFSSALFPTAEHSFPTISSSGKLGGKWRNLILFSGECFEG